MKKVIENVSKNRTFMTEENEKVINIVDHILYFNQLDQSGQGLKTLTPNQVLNKLPISLAQLKAENNSGKFKSEISSYCICCTDQKNLQKMSIII